MNFRPLDHVVLNAVCVAIGALWWPLHLVGFWPTLWVSLAFTLVWVAYRWPVLRVERP